MSTLRAKMPDAPNGRRKVGRPTAGAKAGEKVKDYPQLSVRVPPEIKTQVAALSEVRGVSQWHVIIDAIECYFRDLSSGEQQAVRTLVRRQKAANGR
jgi:hypothetical protein